MVWALGRFVGTLTEVTSCVSDLRLDLVYAFTTDGDTAVATAFVATATVATAAVDTAVSSPVHLSFASDDLALSV